MNFTPLSETEVRVLGALIEKDLSTPEYYPLSLNALVNACNQKSNRHPVASYDDATVSHAFDSLRERKLALVTTGGEHRVPKYSHRISETLNLGNRELAVLCELMLRGPQTPGELKSRTQRLHRFEDLESIESCLRRLMEWQPEPLVVQLPRQPGFRELRYAHLLSGEVHVPEAEAANGTAPQSVTPSEMEERVTRLEAELETLRSELDNLRKRLETFVQQFQ
jgi:uncharacterized protein